MKKSIAITIIAILAVAAIALGVLYVTNNDSKTKEIASRDADIASKAGEIETLNADVAAKAGEIETLNADVAEKAGQIEALNADVTDKTGQIEALTADVADKAGQIDALTADVADKAGQIDALTADVADKAGQIETLNADVADKAGRIETLNADVADKAGQIEALNADVAEKADQVETLNADVADKAGQIETLNAEVADKSGQIEALNTSVEEKNKNIESLNATIKEQAARLDYANMSEDDLNGVVQQITPPLEALGYSVLVRNFGKANTVAVSDNATIDQQFLSDLCKGLEDRWMLSSAETATMTDQQQIEFYQALVNAELNYLSGYTDLTFEDSKLAEYAHTYISALQDQLIAITEYYGRDDAAYDQLWSDAYYTRCQMIYWLNRKYGLSVSDTHKDTLNEMIGIGGYVDHYKSVDSSLKAQLEAAELRVTEQTDYNITVQAPSIKNDTAYAIDSLYIQLYMYDENNNLVDTTYLNSSSSIRPGAEIDLGAAYIFKHFDHYEMLVEYYISSTVNGQDVYESFKIKISPNEQFGWNGAIIKNGELASGQPIYVLENLVKGWEYNQSWGESLYVPYLKFFVKNTGDKAGNQITIKVSFIDREKNEVWNEKTDYLIGSSDAPLQPGYSKKAFIYSSAGYENVPDKLPKLTAEIYINNTLVETVDIDDPMDPEETEAAETEAAVAVMTHEEFVKAELNSPVTIEAYVQANQSWWNGTIKLYMQDENHGGYFVYDMPCTEEEAAKITVPGTKLRISGVKAAWSGEVEILDAKYEILEGSFAADPEDVTALFGKKELIDHMNEKIAVKGAKVVGKTIEGQEGEFAFLYAWDGSGSHDINSDLYFDVEIDGQVYSFTVESYLCDNTTDVYKAVEALKVGDVIDLEGFLYWYAGPNPHIVSVVQAAKAVSIQDYCGKWKMSGATLYGIYYSFDELLEAGYIKDTSDRIFDITEDSMVLSYLDSTISFSYTLNNTTGVLDISSDIANVQLRLQNDGTMVMEDDGDDTKFVFSKVQ